MPERLWNSVKGHREIYEFCSGSQGSFGSASQIPREISDTQKESEDYLKIRETFGFVLRIPGKFLGSDQYQREIPQFYSGCQRCFGILLRITKSLES